MDLSRPEDQALYTLGQMFARKSESLKLNEKEMKIVFHGFKDWMLTQKAAVDYEVHLNAVQKFFDQRMESSVQVEKKQGSQFLKNFLSEGGKTTGSGLAYRIIKPGSARKPQESDWVEVHYQGALPNGHIFDSSLDRKEVAKFQLNQVIRGWTEGLQLIGEGGEIELVIPPQLAYGEAGVPPSIPRGATLKFKIQLFKIAHSK